MRTAPALCGEAFARAFERAGAPGNLSPPSTPLTRPARRSSPAEVRLRQLSPARVRGGHGLPGRSEALIDGASSWGGKDLLRGARRDLDHAVANIVDGAFYNAGQSCCGIERI